MRQKRDVFFWKITQVVPFFLGHIFVLTIIFFGWFVFYVDLMVPLFPQFLSGRKKAIFLTTTTTTATTYY